MRYGYEAAHVGSPRSFRGVDLVANKFAAKAREWRGVNGQTGRAGRVLFPDNAELADEYLDATEKYLDRRTSRCSAIIRSRSSR